MPFDQSLDKKLFSETVEVAGGKLTVSVFSYNNATPKLQISRENLNPQNDEFIFAKLGRMTKEEVEKTLPLIEKALKAM